MTVPAIDRQIRSGSGVLPSIADSDRRSFFGLPRFPGLPRSDLALEPHGLELSTLHSSPGSSVSPHRQSGPLIDRTHRVLLRQRSRSNPGSRAVWLLLVVTVGGGAVPAADFVEDTGTVVPLPPTLVADPLGMPIVPPSGLGRWLETAPGGLDGVAIPAIETVAKPLEEFVKTPWKAPVFGAATRPGLLVRQQGQLPFGIDAEWRVGVAVDTTGPGKGEFADATQWTIRKAVANDFFIYLHERGSGFVKHYGERVSVFGRYIATGDKADPVSTVQIGAAKSY